MILRSITGIERSRLLNTLESQRVTAMRLGKMREFADYGYGGHLSRVQNTCWILAYHARESVYRGEITCEDSLDITLASALHDIGKVGVPLEILNKPGKLSDDEMEIMRGHVNIGVQILDGTVDEYRDTGDGYLSTSRDIISYHHEWWNGGGYPNGIKGLDIPISARICALADVYDALREKRVYKRAMTHEEALEIIKDGKGRHFDPGLADAFIEFNKEIELPYETNLGIKLVDALVTVN